MRYRLRNSADINYVDGKTYIQLGTKLWKIVDSKKKFYNFVKSEYFDDNYSDSILSEFFDFLKKEFLVIEDVYYEKNRFTNNKFFFEDVSRDENCHNNIQTRISDKKVCIVGLGGIGTVILQNLVFAGVKNYILIDKDTVEVTNLNRQLYFSSDDIGSPKVDVLTSCIRKFDEDINVTSKTVAVNSIEDLSFLTEENTDLIVGAADLPSTINLVLAEKAKNISCNFICGSVGIDSGFFTRVLDNDDFERAYLYFNSNDNKKTPMKASISSTNMLIASYISHEIIKYWCSIPRKKSVLGYVVNFMNYSIIEEKFV